MSRRFGQIQRLRWLAAPVLAAAIVLVGVGLWGQLSFGTVRGTMAFFQGYSLLIDEPTKHIGMIWPGEEASVGFVLTNLRRQPVTIYGAQTSCECVTASDLPMTIAPGESGESTFSIVASKEEAGSGMRQIAELFVSPQGPQLVCTIVARVAGDEHRRSELETVRN